MNRSCCAFLLVNLVLLICRFDLQSQPATRHYTCFRTLTGITIDGNLSDPAWRDIPWSEPFTDIEGAIRPTPPLETRMKMTWDDSCLYIGARLIEPHLFATLTQRDDLIYYDPDFEVFVDPDGDALNYYEFEINALGTEMDLFMNRSYKNGGKYNLKWNLDGIRSAVSLEGSLNDPSDRDTAWTVEIAIPWRAFRGDTHIDQPPQPGENWRINFSRVQWGLQQENATYNKASDPLTGKPLQENNWVWSPTGVINMHIPEKWGYVEFSEQLPPPHLWVWMGQGNRSNDEWEALLMGLDTLGIRGLLLSADTTTLSLVASLSAQFGIEVHCWIWTMNRGDADPAWLDYNRLGQSLANEKAYVDYYKFMNPALPDVQEFLRTKFRDLASVKGLKGIHMDYIRYVDAILPSGLQPKYGVIQDRVFPQFDYGYHPMMMELFKEQYGVDPLDSVEARSDSLWLAFRLDQLNQTVEILRNQVKNHGLEISAAVFPTPEMSRSMVRQDWDSWKLDTYFPMVYHNFYEMPVGWIQTVMEENKRLLPETRVICGLYLPALQEDNDLTEAMAAALAGGADGIAFFNFGNLNESLRKQIKELR